MRSSMRVLAGVTASLVAVSAWATEGGGGAYPNGVEDFMSGAVPPPGDYLLLYGLNYQADELKDGGGDTIPGEFDLTLNGGVIRYIHVTEKKILGGHWGQHIVVPLVNSDVTLPNGASDEKFGMGDIAVNPLIISWHKPPFHWAFGLDVYLPVGEYDEEDIANIGRNYWTFEPAVAVTYLNEKGLELSAKVIYDVNLENEDTDFDSGDELHADLAAGMHVGKWKLGVAGFAYTQVTDDDGPEGSMEFSDAQQFALGPAASYQAGPCFVTAKYQFEFETKDRPEGERLWLRLICPF